MRKKAKDLYESLESHHKKNIVSFHMPGHKENRDISSTLNDLGCGKDITEIRDFDDLHDPRGILRQGMDICAKVYHSKNTYFLVNGSTAGLLAAMRSATTYGDEIIVARNCHQAIYHGIELCGLKPHYINVPLLKTLPICGSVPVDDVAKALEEYPNSRMVVLTSPTYDGVGSDVAEICRIAHGIGIPVLVDEAHGAHFGLSSFFPKSAMECGADMVIQSSHKTLLSLTQTAIAHVNGSLISPGRFQKELRVFQSSSPSYLLLASLDHCFRLIEKDGKNLFSSWEKYLTTFLEQCEDLKYCKVFGRKEQFLRNDPNLFDFDPSKILIDTRRTKRNAVALGESLYRDFQIELEMTLDTYAVAMTGLGSKEEDFRRLSSALHHLDRGNEKMDDISFCKELDIPEQACCPSEAMNRKAAPVAFDDIKNRISGEYIFAYPPGVPIIVPGERFNERIIERISTMMKENVEVKSTYGTLPREIFVLESQ